MGSRYTLKIYPVREDSFRCQSHHRFTRPFGKPAYATGDGQPRRTSVDPARGKTQGPMDHLTKDTIQTIERLHSAWIELEVAGEAQGLLACCAEDIELRPPHGPSVYGRDTVLAY